MSDRTRTAAAVAENEAAGAVPPVRILVVCTANICRSPVVEALLRAKLAARGHGSWQVASGGLLAGAGHPASKHGVKILASRGLDLQGHRSHEVGRADVEVADLVLCMERRHAEALEVENRSQREKIYLLTAMIGHDEDIADPYGGPRPWYETMVAEVDEILDRGLERIIGLATEHHAARLAKAAG